MFEYSTEIKDACLNKVDLNNFLFSLFESISQNLVFPIFETILNTYNYMPNLFK